MAIIYVLAALWSIGVVAALVVLIRMAWDEGIIFFIVLGGIGVPMACVGSAVPWFLIADSSSPVLATLKKGEWHCTDSKTVTHMALVGKILDPQTRTICTQYTAGE